MENKLNTALASVPNVTEAPKAMIAMVPGDPSIVVPEGTTQADAPIRCVVRHAADTIKAADLRAVTKIRTEIYRKMAVKAGLL